MCSRCRNAEFQREKFMAASPLRKVLMVLSGVLVVLLLPVLVPLAIVGVILMGFGMAVAEVGAGLFPD